MPPRQSKFTVDLMLDSGAFSAWNRGTPIDLNKYIGYLKANKHLLHSYISLDIIPGESGSAGRRNRQLKDYEVAARGSYENHQKMRAEGLSPIPVFHQGESYSWLERMLKDGEAYISLSPFKDVNLKTRQRWLDRTFAILKGSKVKTHGLSATHYIIMRDYPWTSVDSTTWSITPGYGGILVPAHEDGKPNYLLPYRGVIMTGVNHQWGQVRQFGLLGPTYQREVRSFLDGAGITVSEACNFPDARRKAVLHYFLQLQKHLSGTIFFATNPFNHAFSNILTQMKAKHRLISYFDIQNKPHEMLEQYIRMGRVGEEYKPKPKKFNPRSQAYRNARMMQTIARNRNNETDGTAGKA